MEYVIGFAVCLGFVGFCVVAALGYIIYLIKGEGWL